MAFFQRIRGTVLSIFQVGGSSGPALKDVGGLFAARNAADAAFVNVRGADPVINDDLVTKRFLLSSLPATPTYTLHWGNATVSFPGSSVGDARVIFPSYNSGAAVDFAAGPPHPSIVYPGPLPGTTTELAIKFSIAAPWTAGDQIGVYVGGGSEVTGNSLFVSGPLAAGDYTFFSSALPSTFQRFDEMIIVAESLAVDGVNLQMNGFRAGVRVRTS